jgi:hypothetical protein
MIRFLRYLRREIRCQSRPIVDLLNSFQTDLPVLCKMELREPFDLLCSYRDAKIRTAGEMFFSSADWQAADELFCVLGHGDLEAQDESLRICEEAFCRSVGCLREKVARNGKPAMVLGVSVGAVLILLLI